MAVLLTGGASWGATAAQPKIAFVSSEEATNLFVVNADGTGLRKLSRENGDREAGEPDWDPDGQRIAFTTGNWSQHRRQFDIFVVNVDGSGRRNLTSAAFDDNAPDWSPDGKRVVFTRSDDSHSDIVVMNENGSGKRVLMPGPDLEREGAREPEWSPDGMQIAFVCGPGICVMNADGSGKRRLTRNDGDGRGIGAGPVWSPDGAQIAFVRCSTVDGGCTKRSAIYVTNPDGGGLHKLTANVNPDSQPAWSPDSSQVLFSAVTLDKLGYPRAGSIYVVNRDGTGLHRIVRGPGVDYSSPTWSSDGLRIAFVRYSLGGIRPDVLNRMNSDGGAIRRVLRGSSPSSIWEASWQPQTP